MASYPTPFVVAPVPQIPGNEAKYYKDIHQAVQKTLSEVLDMIPQAATSAPAKPRAGMIRRSVDPWWPVSGQTSNRWVIYSGTEWEYLTDDPSATTPSAVITVTSLTSILPLPTALPGTVGVLWSSGGLVIATGAPDFLWASLVALQPSLATVAPGSNGVLWNNAGTLEISGAGTVTATALTDVMNALPTTLPATSGILWNNGGALCVS